MNADMIETNAVTVRTNVQPGDIGAIAQQHGLLYAREYDFDATFEAYVAGPLAEFVLRGSPRERIWIAEHEGRLCGSIAIVAASQQVAQLRWFLVDPAVRGAGLGRRLLDSAIAFSIGGGYGSIILWTVNALSAAAHLYQSVGFRKVQESPGRLWGADVVQEKYEFVLV